MNNTAPCWGCEEYFDVDLLTKESEIESLSGVNARWHCQECRIKLNELLNN